MKEAVVNVTNATIESLEKEIKDLKKAIGAKKDLERHVVYFKEECKKELTGEELGEILDSYEMLRKDWLVLALKSSGEDVKEVLKVVYGELGKEVRKLRDMKRDLQELTDKLHKEKIDEQNRQKSLIVIEKCREQGIVEKEKLDLYKEQIEKGTAYSVEELANEGIYLRKRTYKKSHLQYGKELTLDEVRELAEGSYVGVKAKDTKWEVRKLEKGVLVDYHLTEHARMENGLYLGENNKAAKKRRYAEVITMAKAVVIRIDSWGEKSEILYIADDYEEAMDYISDARLYSRYGDVEIFEEEIVAFD